MQDIKHIFNQLGVGITDTQISELKRYYELLIETNKVMNLTAITEYDDVVIKHFADSAAIVKSVELSSVGNLIDVGTGAGFPGLVLKILFPELQVTLLDSLNKRINFLNNVISDLGITGITAVHGRAEDFAHKSGYREHYDLAVARAVTNMSSLSEYCLPFVKVGGQFVAYKASDCDTEVSNASNAIRILGGSPAYVSDCRIPDSDIARKFVCIKKSGLSPSKYPRKAGLPTKEPIV